MENHLNGTDALVQEDNEISAAVFEFKVFNIVITVLALCILAVTGVYCITVCYNRTRQSKRAHVYESAVTQGEPDHPVSVKAVKRSTSFLNPLAFLRRSERAKDNSRIYYIYSNPLPIGLKEDEEKEVEAKVNWDPEEKSSPTFEEYARDPNSGVILDPPVFYMQL
ncbi:uncharacterized protein si:dkey-246e1.3 [Periophthalmus magnuspinnatus]|uniref:uncharacterized protein si:dkey-246e1.3 n=1 Tax=Periophthalmus magnuspinnatus TaxID=409849 RepID=UPI0024365736|nr:uncharacterized protein si:dkey-246e1.3 [Periophthalmus magnuspinnatus]